MISRSLGWSNPEAAADLSDDEGDDDEQDVERFRHLWADLPNEPDYSVPREKAKQLADMLLQHVGWKMTPDDEELMEVLRGCITRAPDDALADLVAKAHEDPGAPGRRDTAHVVPAPPRPRRRAAAARPPRRRAERPAPPRRLAMTQVPLHAARGPPLAPPPAQTGPEPALAGQGVITVPDASGDVDEAVLAAVEQVRRPGPALRRGSALRRRDAGTDPRPAAPSCAAERARKCGRAPPHAAAELGGARGRRRRARGAGAGHGASGRAGER